MSENNGSEQGRFVLYEELYKEAIDDYKEELQKGHCGNRCFSSVAKMPGSKKAYFEYRYDSTDAVSRAVLTTWGLKDTFLIYTGAPSKDLTRFLKQDKRVLVVREEKGEGRVYPPSTEQETSYSRLYSLFVCSEKDRESKLREILKQIGEQELLCNPEDYGIYTGLELDVKKLVEDFKEKSTNDRVRKIFAGGER